MTKPIASVALMALFEENRFGLDEPASKYIPELKELKVFAGGTSDKYDVRTPSREPTIRDMLTHCCGFGPTSVVMGPNVIGQIYTDRRISGIPSSGTLATQM